MLGGPVHYKNEPYYRLKMDDLPGHTKLKVKFKVWLIDGEYGNFIYLFLFFQEK